MDHTNQYNLLPIGNKIDLNGNDLEIVRKLGPGYTSVVYEGWLELLEDGHKKHVAVKVFKPSDLQEMKSTFHEEAYTLRAFMEEELRQDNYAYKVIKIAPEFYGEGDYQGNSFLVMEFIQGEELPALLKNQPILSEKQTLTIAWQFFRLLEIMHSKLKLTYIDMKLENLWWTGAGDGGLRVIDLGMLQPIKPDANYIGNPRLDLLKASTMMFRLVTGKNLMLDVTDLKQLAEPIIEEAQISWGLQELFKKALSRNPSYRPANASELKEAFYDLLSYWNLSLTELVNDSEESFKEYGIYKDANDIANARDRITRSMAMMSVYKNRATIEQISDYSEFIKNIEDAVKASSYLEFGKELLNGGSYKAAVLQLSLGESLATNQAAFRRWKHIGMIGEELLTSQFTPDLRRQVGEAVDRMNAEDYQGAFNRFNLLQEFISSKGLSALLAECEIFIGMENARLLSAEGNYPAAANLYKSLQQKIKSFPIESVSLIDEIGDINSATDEMEKFCRTFSKAQGLIQGSIGKMRDHLWNEAIKSLSYAWLIYPKSEIFLPILKEGMEIAFSNKQLDEACRLGHLASFIDNKDYDLFILREAAVRLSFLRKLFIQDDIDSAMKEARLISSNTQLLQRVNVQLQEMLENNAHRWIKAKDVNRLELLLGYLVEYFPTENILLDDIQKNIIALSDETTQQLQKLIDSLISSATARMFVVNPNAIGDAVRLWPLSKLIQKSNNRCAELREIRQDLEYIKRISAPINYRIDVIEQMILGVDEQNINSKEELSEAQNQLGKVNSRIREFENRFSKIRLHYSAFIKSIDEGLSAAVQAQIRKDVTILVTDLLIDLYSHTKVFDSDNKNIQEMYSELWGFFDSLNIEQWDDLIEYAEKKKNEIADSISKIDRLINSGNIDQASSEISLLESNQTSLETLQSLKKRILQIKEFYDWQTANTNDLEKAEYNQHVLDKIKQFCSFDKFISYLRGTITEKYLTALSGKLDQQMRLLIKNPERTEYLIVLKQWLSLQIIKQALSIHNTN